MPQGISKAAELRRERKALAEKAGAILTKADKEGRGMTEDESVEHERLHGEADALFRQITAIERQENLDTSIESSLGVEREEGESDAGDGRGSSDVSKVLDGFFRKGARNLDECESIQLQGEEDLGRASTIGLDLRNLRDESLAARREGRIGFRGMRPAEVETLESNLTRSEVRALSTGTATAGQEMVAEGFWPSFVEAMVAFGGMRQASNVFSTPKGNDLPIVTMDDTSNKGALLSENTEDEENDPPTGEVIFKAYKYTSKFVKVSVELLQDSEFDVPGLIGRILGIRLSRATNEHYSIGDGSAKPAGAMNDAVLGKTTASNSAIAWSEWLDLKHSVDPSYRVGPGVAFGFNDATLAANKKIVDGDSRPLWQAGVAVGEPDRMDGDRYYVNQDYASIASAAKVGIYGNHSLFWIRDVLSISLQRLNERFASKHQVGFVAIMRTDSHLIDAGTNPLKFLQMAV